MTPLLEVTGLRIAFPGQHGPMYPVDGVTFSVRRGELLALVGESGSGKSLSCLAILGLVPTPGRIDPTSRILLGGTSLPDLNREAMRRVRGRRIGMIFQDPTTSLNPVFTIGRQLEEAVANHFPGPRAAIRARAVELLGEVGVPEPAGRLASYPHELSGGLRQRVMIALALSGEPDLLLADEPTSSLDVTVQAQILALLDRLRASRGMAVVLVTHDLGLVAGRADHVAVMYAGQVVERATAVRLFAAPAHPYTRGLFRSVPRLDAPVDRLAPIPGVVPTAARWPAGCRFHPRCPEALTQCQSESPALRHVGPDQSAACLLLDPPQAGG
ncbi:MAG: ABC transporter ATP-binding protein [Gemmatimonadota bacterium]|nr:ABC transporter ATP-binding protein [Gemmatimonadota bacterium]